MIEIDGSQGEGGGQIIRTAVAFSAINQEPVQIRNIRAGRDRPGLRPQHLKALQAVGLLCDARVEGLSVGSCDISFFPGPIKAGNIRVDVGTAGSVTLVLQALLPVLLKAPGPVTVDVSGGTDVSFSPSIDYFRHVFCFFLERMGAEVDVKVMRRGFFPKGGGRLLVSTRPWDFGSHIQIEEAGEFLGIDVHSVASEHLMRQDVAERQARGFARKLSPNFKSREIQSVYEPSDSVGSSITCLAEFEKTRKGVCALGQQNVRAEDVGNAAAIALLAELASNAPLDACMADQIVPYLAQAGGTVRVSRVTEHARTNIDVVNMFGYGLVADGTILSADG
jgi:RNA 3'-terminal phosphate cyclase (GTP)